MKWIYLIKAEKDDIEYYKIGITKKDPELRLKQLQTGNALKLELICKFKSEYGNILENTLHRTFLIEKENGEWFSLSREQVLDFMNICNRIENNLKCVHEESTLYSLSNKKKFF
jgi:hypothetical protein